MPSQRAPLNNLSDWFSGINANPPLVPIASAVPSRLVLRTQIVTLTGPTNVAVGYLTLDQFEPQGPSSFVNELTELLDFGEAHIVLVGPAYDRIYLVVMVDRVTPPGGPAYYRAWLEDIT